MSDRCVDVLLREQEKVREDVLNSIRNQSRLVLGFTAVLGVAAKVYWDVGLIGEASMQAQLLFLLSQLQIFLLLFYLSQVTRTAVGSIYLASVERKLNSLCEATVAQWESTIVPKSFFGAGSPFLWATIGMFALAFSLLALLLVWSLELVTSSRISLLLYAEGAFLFFVGILLLLELRRMRQGTAAEVGLEVGPESSN